ncbi:MAG TPA: alpha/beta hydrolase-fold protein [Stellaceae bacterium]|jgi:pimeloyl-ACP methyl ester carboxylesterase
MTDHPAGSHGIERVFYPSPRGDAAETLLVLLPGVGIGAADFVAHNFVAMLHAGEAAVDLVIAAAETDHYLDGTITGRLIAMLAEQCPRHYRRLWLGGISLGGLGALLAASTGRIETAGVILLSPFLGTPGLIAEIERAGGLAAWEPGAVAANDGERRVLAWLKDHLAAGHPLPHLQLGYGRSDRFAAAAALLAQKLCARQVHRVEGGHDWPTWTALWQRILDERPFSETADSWRHRKTGGRE